MGSSSNWKDKIDPAYLEQAELFERALQFGRIQSEEASELARKLLKDAQKHHRALFGGQDLAPKERKIVSSSQPQLTLGDLVFQWLCWMKWQRTPEQLLVRMQLGDINAYDKLAKIYRMHYLWRWGRLRDWQFKADERHSTLVLAGLSYGVEKLSEQELADCFDCVCHCEREHSSEALKKLRRRILKNLRAAP